MAKIKGKDVLIKIGATPASIAGQTEGTLSYSHDAIETTSKSDYPIKTYTLGWTNWQLTCNAISDVTDAALEELEEAVTTPLTVNVQFDMNAVTRTGTGVVTSFEWNAPQDGMMTASITIQGTGALTESA